MADDMLIGVGVKADFSSLKSEVKEAASALKKAKAEWQDAFEKLGKSAAQGNQQAIEALKQYETALDQAVARERAALQALEDARREATQKRIQQARDYQEWLDKGARAAKAEAEAAKAEAEAVGHTVPQFAAASGAIRTLEGNITNNVRAAERFLTTSLGLGPVLQAAFPVVGAVAMLGVLFELGKKVVEFGIDAAELGRELGVGWLDAAIAQMTGLGEAAKHADEEILKLARDRDQSKQEERNLDVEAARLRDQLNNTNTAPGIEKKQLEDRIAALKQLIAVQKQAVDEAASRKAEAEQEEVPAAPSALSQLAGRATNIASIHDRAQAIIDLKVATDQYDTSLSKLTELEQKSQVLDLKEEVRQQKVDKKDASAANKADEQRLRADELALDQLRINHKLTIEEERAYWEQRIANYSKSSAQYAQITAKIRQVVEQERREEERSLKEGRREATDEIITEKRRELQQNEEISAEVVKTWQDELKAQEEAAQAATRAADAQIEAAARVAEARVQYELATGAIDQQTAAQELAAIKAKAYTDQIKALEDELRKLQEIESLGGNTQKRQGEDRTRITELGGNRDAVLIEGATRNAAAFEKPWLRAFDGITRGWMRVQDQIFLGQMSLAQGAVRMLQELELSFIHALENILLEEIRTAAMRKVVHQTTNTQLIASDAEASAADTAIHKKSAFESIFIDAKTAAAGAFKGVMTHVPFPANVVLAPVAAAAAFTGVMALAAFEHGGIVSGQIGSMVPIAAHAGERVLSVAQTRNFETLVSNASAVRNSVNISARINQNFPNSKASSARETRSQVQGLMRRGKLALD